MLVEHARRGQIAVLRYMDFRVTGLLGNWNTGLKRVPGIYQKYPCEFGTVKDQGVRYFLAGFAEGPVDMTFIESKTGPSSIVFYSLDEDSGVRLLQPPVERDFTPIEPAEDFIGMLETELIGVQSKIYNGVEQGSRISNVPKSDMFGLAVYANFLCQYKGVPDEEAVIRSARKFRIKLSSF